MTHMKLKKIWFCRIKWGERLCVGVEVENEEEEWREEGGGRPVLPSEERENQKRESVSL